MPRLSDAEVNKSIHRITDSKKVNVVEAPVTSDGYDARGNAIGVDDAGCIAKLTSDTGTGGKRYWVKFATFGPESGKMYNPQSPNFQPLSVKAVDPMRGRTLYEFRQVNAVAFELYVGFLKTGNPVNLRNAERESV